MEITSTSKEIAKDHLNETLKPRAGAENSYNKAGKVSKLFYGEVTKGIRASTSTVL